MVRVGEDGTEAAAASAASMRVASGRFDPRSALIVDRSFVFLISEDATGTLLSVGRGVNPKAG
jgi:serpin B